MRVSDLNGPVWYTALIPGDMPEADRERYMLAVKEYLDSVYAEFNKSLDLILLEIPDAGGPPPDHGLKEDSRDPA